MRGGFGALAFGGRSRAKDPSFRRRCAFVRNFGKALVARRLPFARLFSRLFSGFEPIPESAIGRVSVHELLVSPRVVALLLPKFFLEFLGLYDLHGGYTGIRTCLLPHVFFVRFISMPLNVGPRWQAVSV